MADDRVHPVRKRLEFVLRGRSMRQWQTMVQLSAGTASRLFAGDFPDPEKLLPAIRIERLSLSWLLDGIGTPFSVHAPATDREGARLLERLIVDEPRARVVLVHSPSGFTVVVYRQALSEAPRRAPYGYMAADVIGGEALKTETALLVLEHVERFQEVRLEEQDRVRLASGYMSNTELFGEPEQQSTFFAQPFGGLLATASKIPIRVRDHAIPDPSILLVGRAATYLVDDEREVIRIFRSLDKAGQAMLLRMLRGLKAPASAT